MTHELHLNEICVVAAALYGQKWSELDANTKQRWNEVARSTGRLCGSTFMEQCVGKAIHFFYLMNGEIGQYQWADIPALVETAFKAEADALEAHKAALAAKHSEPELEEDKPKPKKK